MFTKKLCRDRIGLIVFLSTCCLLCYVRYLEFYDTVASLRLSLMQPLESKDTKQSMKTSNARQKKAKRHISLTKRKPQNRTGPTVIIVTMGRSGSSIFGSMFNQENSRAFYLYEPLFPFDDTCDKFEKVEVLKHLSKCEFEEIQPLYRKAFSRLNRTDMFARCKHDKICFADIPRKVAAFRPKKVCINESGKVSCKRNGTFSLPALSKNCSQNSHVVLKLINLCRLKWLLPLLQDPAYDVKVIHLVRDPRATVKSRAAPKLQRAATIRFFELRKQAKKVCGQLTPNLDYADNVLSKLVSRNKYLRIRFEDFAWNPVTVAKTVYDFIGMNITEEIENWLWSATSPINHKNWSKLSAHGLRRNAKFVISAWRSELSYYKVYLIQKVCSKALKHLGYKTFTTEKALRDLKNLHFEPKF